MGLLSLFNRKPSAPEPTSEPGSAPAPVRPPELLWRKSDFEFFPAGDEQHLVSRAGSVPVSVPSYVVDFLLHCDEFQSMEAHISRYAEPRDWNPLQVEALVLWLPRLQENGFLISPEDLRRQCAAMVDPSNAPEPVQLIGFPTGGNRTAMLERCLRSFADNLRDHRRQATLLVTDSSALPEQRAAFVSHLRALQPEFGQQVRYMGEDEKRRFAAALIERSGCRASSVEFALFDPLNAGFLCGANRNALLLHEAGRTTVSVDDDVICDIAQPPPAEKRVGLFCVEDPCDRWYYPDRPSALQDVEFTKEVDFLATHETILGRDIGVLFPRDLTADDIDVEWIDDRILERLTEKRSRMRSTFYGHVGDTGTPTSCYYFFAKGRARERLTHSEELYRAAFSSRSVVVRTPTTAIGGPWLSPGMTIGLDNREILPPFFPVLHAEDTIWATATWLCCSHSVVGHVPYALHHDSGHGKRIHHPDELTDDRRATVFEFAMIVRAILFRCAPPEHPDSAERIRTLGRTLSAFAARPAKDFVRALRLVVQQTEADKLSFLQERLREEEDAPDYWRDDLEKFIAHTRDALTHEDFDIPFELKEQRSDAENRELMQALLASYGALLEDWPEIFAAARALREEGRIYSAEIRHG